jgi:molybdopterin molybdotransferase
VKKEIGFAEALHLTFANTGPLGSETLPLERLTGRVLSTDVVSKVDSPSVDASLKDGYAVRSQDLEHASVAAPVVLELTGRAAAGNATTLRVDPGQAIRVTTGAPIPVGADAVLAEEFTEVSGRTVVCREGAESGRNVLPRGTDIRKGATVAKSFDRITPPLVGLLATAGIDLVEVFRNPLVCVMATGDEIVAPGHPLPEGMLYASNLTEICAWLAQHRVPTQVSFAGDTATEVASAIEQQIDYVDAFISSGGIWGSERDLMLQVLEAKSWHGIYHRVRIGPGKAIAFGLLKDKPFFCLPGGPPSNEMAFLQIALPGILRMIGHTGDIFPLVRARLAATVRGVSNWTQFIHAEFAETKDGPTVTPLEQKSRLQSMAEKNALICIPEGCEVLTEGTVINAQILDIQALNTSEPQWVRG